MDQHDHSCLNDEQLEAIACGECAEQSLLEHIDRCESCKKRLDEVQSNNQFLDLFAQAVSLDEVPANPIAQHDDAPIPQILPGGYKVECEMHRGGHGVVYRATQIQTNRPVAVKMLILGTQATPRQRMRFEREAEIVAALRHPGIVTIYDAGYLDDGRFGFAMEYVDGVTLDRWSAKNQMKSQSDIRARLELFLMICDAVNFAHQFGVVHRDLKPANILVDKDDKPHILDFGIAKVLKEDGETMARFGEPSHDQVTKTVQHTLPGEFSGTLSYASPEQVSGDPKCIDSRTDIYSLGVILYELLCGRLPYSVSGPIDQVVKRIQTDEPEAISRQSSLVDRDLSEIVVHAIQKDKRDRYESVYELSQDIQNYLEGKPIKIRRDNTLYVVGKTIRRKWISVSILSLSLLTLAAFSIAMTLLYNQKNHAETDAILQLRSRDLAHARTEGLIGDASLALDMLWRAQLVKTKGLGEPEELLFGNAFEPIDSYWDLWSFYARNPILKSTAIEQDLMGANTVSSNGRLAVSYFDHQLHFYSIGDHQSIRSVSVRFPDWFVPDKARVIFRVTDDSQSVVFLGKNGVVLWDAFTGEVQSTLRFEETAGSLLKTLLANGYIALADADQLRILEPQKNYRETLLDIGVGELVYAMLSPDRTLLATAVLRTENYLLVESVISIWSMPGGDLVAQCTLPGPYRVAAFTPDMNAALLIFPSTGKFMLWDFDAGDSPLRTLTTPNDTVPYAWLDEGEKVVCVQPGRALSVWDMNTKEQIHHLAGAASAFRYVLANPDSATLTTISNQSIKTWELDRQLWSTFPQANEYPHHDIALSPDGQSLAWAKNEIGQYQIHISSLTSDSDPIVLDGLDDLVISIAFGRYGKQIAWAYAGGRIVLWDIENNTQIDTFAEHQSNVHSIAMSPAQSLLASGDDDAQIVLRNLDTGEKQILAGHSERIPKVVFRSDGRVLASCSMDGTVRLWDVRTGDLLKVYDLEQGLYGLSFSPDNVHLAACGKSHDITIINTLTDQQTTLKSKSNRVFTIAYGPQGRVLVSGDIEGNLSLWDTQSFRRLSQLPKHEQLVMSIKVSEDGRTMVSCSTGQSPEIRLWDLTALSPHIAGNLEFHASRLKKEMNKEPANLKAMRKWAAKVRQDQQ